MQYACFEKLIFSHVFNARKAKEIAKFDGLERRPCEDRKEIVAAKNKPEKTEHRLKRRPKSASKECKQPR